MYTPDKVRSEMWKELARKGVVTNKRESNVRKYMDALCEKLYLNNQ